MLAFIFANWKWFAIGGLALASVALWQADRRAQFALGEASGREQQIRATLEQLSERNVTNEEVSNMDDAAKCELIGGVFIDGRCV